MVADLGWADGPYEMAARILGAPFGLWVAKHSVYDGMYTVFGPHAPGQVAPILGTVAIPATHPHFPYGLVVSPD